MVNWSSPDENGIQTLRLDVGAKSTLKGRRLRRSFNPKIDNVDCWHTAWKQVLIKWVGQGSGRKKYQSLIKKAEGQFTSALELFDALLESGLIEIEEKRMLSGSWECTWVKFLDPKATRGKLEMRDGDALSESLANLLKNDISNEQVDRTRGEAATKLRTDRAVRIIRLLLKLDDWIESNMSGTERDFAQYATGDTKGISPGDWKWMRGQLEMDDFGVTKHTPAIWMHGPVNFIGNNGGSLDLEMVADCIAITPATIKNICAIKGEVGCYRIVENKTSFERVAKKYGSVDLVLWIPGFAPSWWMSSVGHILRLKPAPAKIAADPDPAGIRIALMAGSLWSKGSWEPWCMSTEDLMGLKEHKELNNYDRKNIELLRDKQLPKVLDDLLSEMIKHNRKGEQEGYL